MYAVALDKVFLGPPEDYVQPWQVRFKAEPYHFLTGCSEGGAQFSRPARFEHPQRHFGGGFGIR